MNTGILFYLFLVFGLPLIILAVWVTWLWKVTKSNRIIFFLATGVTFYVVYRIYETCNHCI